jgi:hypothetical protein
MKPPAPFGWQQPPGQVVGPQLWTTPSQVWETVSHVVKPCAGQFSHACPPLPQAVSARPTSHAPLLSQQPVAHVPGPHVRAAAQTPTTALHVVPGAQAAQVAPWMPQARLDFPGKQIPLALQQPSGHESMSHVALSRFAPSVALSRFATSGLPSGSEPSSTASTRMSVRSPHPADAPAMRGMRTRTDRIESSLARRVALHIGHSWEVRRTGWAPRRPWPGAGAPRIAPSYQTRT